MAYLRLTICPALFICHISNQRIRSQSVMIRAGQTEEEPSVGEQFREIRSQLRRNGNQELEENLVKQLKNRDQKKYWTLVNRHPAIKDALDDVLHIECLWPSFSLSNFHKTSAMKCDQV